MSTSEDTFPLDPAQDRRWPAGKLMTIGALALAAALALIFGIASTLGEQPNQFHHLENTF